MTQSDIINENFSKLKSRKRDIFQKYEIGNDTAIYKELQAMKRSTFDRNKFTVVGNPTITSDGVASGFNTSADTSARTPNINWGNSCILVCKFNSGNLSNNGDLLGRESSTTKCLSANLLSNGKFQYSLSSNGADYDILNYKNGINILSANKDYWLKLTFNGSKYEFSISEDGKNYTLDYAVASYLKLFNSSINLGNAGGATSITYAFNGSIDLSQFSITVDGIEVFNGNKTGIDQIKKDDYTVVGSPVISTDGVASGFSSSNYIRTVQSISSENNTIKIKGKFEVTDKSDNSTCYIFYSRVNEIFGFYISNTGALAIVQGNTYVNNVGASKYNVGKPLFYEVIINNKNIRLILRQDNVIISDANGDVPNFVILNTVDLGYSFNIVANRKIDLNLFEVYVDGNLVYQPTLRIPYTQSKTGCKIVDATYRDRVQDMYEQFGYAHYYTIGDESEKYNVTKVGNPTLVGGVASGFSSGNYVQFDTKINSSSKNYEIEVPFKLNAGSNSGVVIANNTTNTGTQGLAVIIDNNKLYPFIGTSGTGWTKSQRSTSLAIQSNVDYLLKIKRTATQYIFSVYNNNTLIDSISLDDTADIRTGLNALKIGVPAFWSTIAYTCTHDLSKLASFVDGKEVLRGYEPAIVDAYTLPTVSNEKIVDSYYADNSFMELTADLALTQCGGAVSGQTVNLKRPYVNNKYIATIGTSSKATNSFVASASGQWITKGKGVLG